MDYDIKQALIDEQDFSKEEAQEAFQEMVNCVNNGEDPEHILYDYGLEPDYIFDLI